MTGRIAALVCLLAAAGCGSGGGTLDASRLALPTAGASPMASVEVDTSPDGGIYRNPDTLEVVLLATVDEHPIADRLGAEASAWSQLDGLGRFTIIGVRLRNGGKAGSEPALNDLQVASDFAPPATSSGPLRHFYHPTFPLATLSPQPLTGDCTVHLDPGQAAVVLILYPPLRADRPLLWGRYQSFSLRLRDGGGLGALPGELRVRACTPPQPVAT